MKKEKIKDLFNKHSEYVRCYNEEMLDIDDFTKAINQAELEWYKKLEKKMEAIVRKVSSNKLKDVELVYDYYGEILEKIKELENENSLNEFSN